MLILQRKRMRITERASEREREKHVEKNVKKIEIIKYMYFNHAGMASFRTWYKQSNRALYLSFLRIYTRVVDRVNFN